MFNLTKSDTAPTEVGAEEAPVCSTPSLKYHAHDGVEISFRNIVMN